MNVISTCVDNCQGLNRLVAETFSLLEQLLQEARVGAATGFAVAVSRSRGSYDIRLRGNATETGDQMAVAGMLAALQKMVLELQDFGTPE